MEDLYAEFLLWMHGFNTGESYEIKLNKSFICDANNIILLELEECSTNIISTNKRFHDYWNYEGYYFDISAFGKSLFHGLKQAYQSNKLSIDIYGKCCYELWKNLPSQIQHFEPFYTLCYADDCLSWGDESQTRTLYEDIFNYYHNID